MKRIVIFGATSAIAQEVARQTAARGDRLALVGRSAAKLEAIASDLRARGATVHAQTADLNDVSGHAALFDEAKKALGGIDTVLVAHGTLTDQEAAQRDFSVVESELRTNFVSAASIIELAAAHFESQRSGVIAVITSVAGDRGRRKNYVYGAAKAALSTYLSGVRNRLAASGVGVLDIRPGFVDTPMTANIDKGPLFASPQKVARDIVRAIDREADVVYTPFFWWWIMLVIRSLPERVFKRMNI